MPIIKTDLIEKIEQLKKLQADAQKLQGEITNERPVELATLHLSYGFEDVNAFLKAVKDAAASVPAKKAAKAGRKAKASKAVKTPKAAKAPKAAKPGRPKKVEGTKGRRARITEETKSRVQALVIEGKSGQEIAKLVGISMPSVQNIKKALGMVKARGAKAPEAQVAAPVAVETPAVEAPAAPAN